MLPDLLPFVIFEVIALAICYFFLWGQSKCGIDMFQWLRLFTFSLPLIYITNVMCTLYNACNNSLKTAAVQKLLIIAYLIIMVMLTVKGWRMFMAEENNCKAAHPVGHGFMVFMLLVGSVLAVSAIWFFLSFPIQMYQLCKMGWE